MADLILATERLDLRPVSEADLPWLLAEMNTPEVMRHLGGPRSEQAVTENLAADLAAMAEGRCIRWTIWHRDSQCRVGRTGLFFIRSAAAPDGLRGQREIGWSLASAHEGYGYATEAARAALAYAFETMGAEAVYAQASDHNGPSTRLMARLGLLRVPDFDYDDPDYERQENPTRVYGLTRAQWSTQ
ncbi:N-acetyltransferase [Aurantiacibacter xanthus]|uniref:N-acetyltransferase n=1 Tax=Aurantiacibacter xanthus TaxID=1784712 RepID=A0A3A1PFC5_9SPHN|nr:GNAT family N-acetyltransferase [Aurantiacibacter xanthus]RIV92294.1 N-acetyltransferase [Aurantiacibacter xanthus]